MLLLESLTGKDKEPKESRLYSLWDIPPLLKQTAFFGLDVSKIQIKWEKTRKRKQCWFQIFIKAY